MSRLTRDGTAELVSRDQILRRERGQGNVIFSCSPDHEQDSDHEQDWQPYPVDPYSCYLEVYWPCAGGLSAVNAIGTHLRDPINSGLTRRRTMAIINEKMDAAAELGRNPVSTRFSLMSMKMGRLTRDGTAEPVSRDQILRHARGQGDINFPCSADHEQDWQPYPVDPYSAICDDHMCVTIHTSW